MISSLVDYWYGLKLGQSLLSAPHCERRGSEAICPSREIASGWHDSAHPKAGDSLRKDDDSLRNDEIILVETKYNYLGHFRFFYSHLGHRIFIASGLSIVVGLLDGFGLAMFLPLLESVDGQAEVDPAASMRFTD